MSQTLIAPSSRFSGPRAFFFQHNKHNKYDVATLLATWFPELAWKLRRKRKWYAPEPWVMTFFDAVALGVAYIARKKLSKRDIAWWRAYTEILGERIPLVDRWNDGAVTWHPRVVQKLLWYSKVSNTMRDRSLAHDWLMRNSTRKG